MIPGIICLRSFHSAGALNNSPVPGMRPSGGCISLALGCRARTKLRVWKADFFVYLFAQRLARKEHWGWGAESPG